MKLEDIRLRREELIYEREKSIKKVCFKTFETAYNMALAAIDRIPADEVISIFNLEPDVSKVLISPKLSKDENNTAVIFYNDNGDEKFFDVAISNPFCEVIFNLTSDEVTFSSSEENGGKFIYSWDDGVFSREQIELTFKNYLKDYNYRTSFTLSSRAFK